MKFILSLVALFAGVMLASNARAGEDCDYDKHLEGLKGAHLTPVKVVRAADNAPFSAGQRAFLVLSSGERACLVAAKGGYLSSAWVAAKDIKIKPAVTRADWLGKWRYRAGNIASSLDIWDHAAYQTFAVDPDQKEIDPTWLSEFPKGAVATDRTIVIFGDTAFTFQVAGETSANTGRFFDIGDIDGPLFIHSEGRREGHDPSEGPCLIILLRYPDHIGVVNEGWCGGNQTTFGADYRRH